MIGARPRLVIAGTGGDSGKTLVTLGAILAWRGEGLSVAGFKKGPDFIDAAWIAWACGRPPRNLDTFLMGNASVLESFEEHSRDADLSIIEGNRGLFDGLETGEHSTAELAKTLRAPVVLVLPVTKMTRSAAAVALGYRQMDPDVRIEGVILNRTAGDRHVETTRRAIEEVAGLRVLGAIPRQAGDVDLPGRHLGLVTPAEHAGKEALADRIRGLVRDHVDLDALKTVAWKAAPLDDASPAGEEEPAREPSAGTAGGSLAIGVVRDSAFTFYYEENLEALRRGGARIVTVSSLDDTALPGLDALYIGGGFPETHVERLSGNRALLSAVRSAVRLGLPVYAECGGLMYLAEAIVSRERRFEMAGVLPIVVTMTPKPQGHGYMEVFVDRSNPIFSVGASARGHEFHYSVISKTSGEVRTAFQVIRGQGALEGRDGIVKDNVLAGYMHIHAAGCPEWARGMIKSAKAHRNMRTQN